jgi:hypothetical protein
MWFRASNSHDNERRAERLGRELVNLSGADLRVFLPGCGDQQIAQPTAGLSSDGQKAPGPEQAVIGGPDRCPEQMV